MTQDVLYLHIFGQLKQTAQWLLKTYTVAFCEADREDCFQNMQIKIYEITKLYLENKLPFSDDETTLIRYCKTALRNTAADYNRSRKDRAIPAALIELTASEGINSYESPCEPEDNSDFTKDIHFEMTLQKLLHNTFDPIATENFIAKYGSGLTFEEIAAMLNKQTMCGVKNAINRTKQHIKELAQLKNIDVDDVF